MKKLWNSLSSYPAMAVMLVIYAVAMGVATFVESKYGTAVARAWIYNNVWFYGLQLLLVVNFVGVAARQKLVKQKKWGTLVFHYAFAVILVGALVTHLTGKEGLMHIREGERSAGMLDPENPSRVMATLPFEIELKDFRLVRYPGSNSPSSFESDVIVRQPGEKDRAENIYMNNVLHVGAYRLYQTSYDPDEGGTVLTVNHDRAGMLITYTGYFLLLAGMLLAVFHKNSRFRTLARQLNKKGAAAVLGMLLLLPLQAAAQQGPVDTMTWSQLEERSRRYMEEMEQTGQQPRVESREQRSPSAVRMDRQRDKKIAAVYAVDMAIDRGTAKAFGRLMVQDGRGRVEPVDTYASKLLRKISRQGDYNGLNPDQVLLGAIMQPNIWSRVSFIKVGSDQLRERAGGGDEKGYLAFIDVLDDEGDYIFGDEVEAVYAKAARDRNKYDKELLKLDEKVNILMSLFNGQMLAIFPHDGSIDNNYAWYSPGDDLTDFSGQDSMFVSKIFPWFATESLKAVETGNWNTPKEVVGMIATYQKAKAKGQDYVDPGRIEAEMLYNRLDVFKWSGFLNMGFGLLLMLLLIFQMAGRSDPKGLRVGINVLTGVAVLVFLWMSFGVGLRWYISGRPPVSNAYESMVFIGWATALAGLLFARRSRMTMALATFLSGVLLFVSNLNWMDPEITPLVPVLKSPWLMIHVATITGSYGFFGIGFLLGLISLVLMACKTPRNSERLTMQIREFTIINEMLLIVGLVLLTAGTFIGAVWANESWGRYWGWDPKETWALITMIVYAFILHARFIPKLRGEYAFNLMTVIGLGSVLMTFFGVNYYLSGMHSYGGDSAPPGLYAIWIAYGLAAVIAVLAWRKRKI